MAKPTQEQFDEMKSLLSSLLAQIEKLKVVPVDISADEINALKSLIGLHKKLSTMTFKEYTDTDTETFENCANFINYLRPMNKMFSAINEPGSNVPKFKSATQEIHKLNQLGQFNSLLSIINNKAIDLNSRKFSEASATASTLFTTLNELKGKYSDGTINYPKFKEDSLKAIDMARPELEKHRGWKEVFANVALCIFSLCKYMYSGTFFKFNTDSVNKLNGLKDAIEVMAPTI
jgi:hypothetical protein